MKSVLCVDKKQGETPLEALERVRDRAHIEPAVPMTYAGRLDPLASGLLIILVGEECKKKEEYLGLDKVYEFEVLYGVATDTGDVLGEIVQIQVSYCADSIFTQVQSREFCQKFEGVSRQAYPRYSSKTVAGKPLFLYAREGEHVEVPEREITIYSLQNLATRLVTTESILFEVVRSVALVRGDFRQEQIIRKWHQWAQSQAGKSWVIASYKARVSSGAYIRVLAGRLGQACGQSALAWKIHRSEVGSYTLDNIDF